MSNILKKVSLIFATAALVRAQCFSEALGYSCCSDPNTQVYYQDADGPWGVENNQWCGINRSSAVGNCFSVALGYSCCSDPNTQVYYQDADGPWGVENNQWCGIGSNVVKTTTRTTTKTTTTSSSAAVPTSNIPKPNPINLDTINDPAANCDISDSIKGDSLAKLAPYRFGVGITGSSRNNAAVLSKKMRSVIKYQFNSVTYTNMFKPVNILNQSGCVNNYKKNIDEPAVSFDNVVDGLEFCKENGIKMRGHVLVWHTQTPSYFFKEGYDDSKGYVSSQVMEKRLESYIKQVLGFVNTYYPGVVDVWDVVNEAIEIVAGSYDDSQGWKTRTKFDNNTPNPWYKTMGPDYVVKAFRFARKYAAQGVKLVYNDYNTFQGAKPDAIITLAKILKKENLIDALGLQSYLSHTWPNLSDYQKTIKRFWSETGLEIQITELTITSNDTGKSTYYTEQASVYKNVFKIYKECMNSGVKIGSVTVFGLQDGYLFYSSDSTVTRLWDRNLKKKPVFYSVVEALKN